MNLDAQQDGRAADWLRGGDLDLPGMTAEDLLRRHQQEGESRTDAAARLLDLPGAAPWPERVRAALRGIRAGTEPARSDGLFASPDRAAQALKGRRWNPKLHPRDPRTGRFVERPSFGRVGDVFGGETPPSPGTIEPLPDPDEILEAVGDEEYAERFRHVLRTVDDYYAERQSTDELYDQLDGAEGAYTPERERIHMELVDDMLSREVQGGARQEQRVLFMGGLPGAGKSTSQRTEAFRHQVNEDPADYVTVNPDDFKELLVERGLVPEYAPDIDPLEESYLFHEESSKLADDLMRRAAAEGYNVLFDITLHSPDSFHRRMDAVTAQSPDYRRRSKVVFVDVPVSESARRAIVRHQQGMDDRFGGRIVPPEIILGNHDEEWGSKNRRAFEEIKDQVGEWFLFDTSGETRMIDAGTGRGR